MMVPRSRLTEVYRFLGTEPPVEPMADPTVIEKAYEESSPDTKRFLDCAARNFELAASGLGASGCTGALFFVDGGEGDALARLARDIDASDPWTLSSTDEECSALLTMPDGSALLAIAGRQVATRERLEVLALGTTRAFEAGRTFPDTLRSVLESDALAVVPWGFGKWWGRRGRRRLGGCRWNRAP